MSLMEQFELETQKTPTCRKRPLDQNQRQKEAQTKKPAPLKKQLAEPNIKYANAYVKIVEQPASKAVRFRYECEGRSAGSIPGVNSTPEVRTYPSIEICGYKGRSMCVVSCVTKDPPYRPHPHNLLAKQGCKNGVYTCSVDAETMRAQLNNLGIQCVKKKDIEASLKVREAIRVDPFKTGFAHALQPASININAVRLCFQVFIQGQNGQFTVPLKPVVSDPIYDKKSKLDLVIYGMCNSATVLGNTDVILLCEKVTKENIAVRFFEEKNDVVVWQAYGDFQSSDVHKQTSIRLKTPKYHKTDITEPVKVSVQLQRPSDGAVSEPWEFTYEPIISEKVLLKRKCSPATIASEPNGENKTNGERIGSIMKSWYASNKAIQNTITNDEIPTFLDMFGVSSELTPSPETILPLTPKSKSDSSALPTTYGKVTEVIKLGTLNVKATPTTLEDNEERKAYPVDKQQQFPTRQYFQDQLLDQLLQQSNRTEIQQPNQRLQEPNPSKPLQQPSKVYEFTQDQQQHQPQTPQLRVQQQIPHQKQQSQQMSTAEVPQQPQQQLSPQRHPLHPQPQSPTQQQIPQQPQQLQQYQQPFYFQPQQMSMQQHQVLQSPPLLQQAYLRQQQQQMPMQQQQLLIPQQPSQQMPMPPQQVPYHPYHPQQPLQQQQINPQPLLHQQLPLLPAHSQQSLLGNGEVVNLEEKVASVIAFATAALSSNPFNLQHFLNATANSMAQNGQWNFPPSNLQQQQQPLPPSPAFQHQQQYSPIQQYQAPQQQEHLSIPQFQQQTNAATSSNDNTLAIGGDTKNISSCERNVEAPTISHLLNLDSDQLVQISSDDTILDHAILELSSLTISEEIDSS